MTEAERIQELEAQVEQLTRECETAQVQADSRALGALQVLTWDTDLTHLSLLVTPVFEGETVEVKPMVLDSSKIQGIWKALRDRFEENRDWGTLRLVEQQVMDAKAQLKAEGENRDLWQDKAEKADAKLKVLVGMIEGIGAMTDPAIGDLRSMVSNLVESVEVSDTDATIEIRCACWYRARLSELRRQLHVAVGDANPTTVVPEDDDGSQEDKYKAELVRQRSIAGSFTPELRRLSDAVDSMDRSNYATLVGVIPGGSTDRVTQVIAQSDRVDETVNGG